MALIAYNKTTSALTLAAGNPARSLPASASTGVRGPGVNLTTELRGLAGAGYTALQVQVDAGSVDFEWTDNPEYSTGDLLTNHYSGLSSYQPVAPDLNVSPAVGKNLPDTAFIAAVMGNLLGDTLTKTGAYLAGVIGALTVLGTKAAKMGVAGVMGIIMDGVTDADAAVLAVLDGDSAVTTANAMFGVRKNNSVGGSNPNYGLDLHEPGHDGFSALAYLKAPVRLDNNVVVITGAGAPVDGTTGDDVAGPGSFYIDITAGNAYLQTDVITAPVWKLVTRAA